MPWHSEKLAGQAVVGLAAVLVRWFASACVLVPGFLGWIFSRWIIFVEGRVVQFMYPPLELGQKYALVTVEVPWWEVSGK